MPILVAPVSGYVHNGKVEGNPEEKEYEYLFSMIEGVTKAGHWHLPVTAAMLICMQPELPFQRDILDR